MGQCRQYDYLPQWISAGNNGHVRLTTCISSIPSTTLLN